MNKEELQKLTDDELEKLYEDVNEKALKYAEKINESAELKVQYLTAAQSIVDYGEEIVRRFYAKKTK